MRYQSFQLRLNRRFANGASALFGYNYARQKDEIFFNDIDSFEQTIHMAGKRQRRVTG